MYKKHGIYSRPGWNSCSALLGSGGSPSTYPLMTLPVWSLSMVPSFMSITRTSQEEFASTEFGTTKFHKHTKNMASFPVRGGIHATLSLVAGACLPPTPLGHSLCGAYQWSQVSHRSPARRGRSLRTKDFGSTKLYTVFVRIEARVSISFQRV